MYYTYNLRTFYLEDTINNRILREPHYRKTLQCETADCLTKKLNLIYDPKLFLSKVKDKIKSAHNLRKEQKGAESLSLKHRTRLTLSKEKPGEVKESVCLRNINRLEAKRNIVRYIRYTERRITCGNNTQFTITSPNGKSQEYTCKVYMEQGIYNSNEKVHQSKGGSQLLSPSYTKNVGNFGEGPQTKKC